MQTSGGSTLWDRRNSGSDTDVRLICYNHSRPRGSGISPQTILRAHRNILAESSSELFRQIFSDAKIDEIVKRNRDLGVVLAVPYASAELMTKVLKFMYTGEAAEWELDELNTVLELASYLGMNDLQNFVRRAMGTVTGEGTRLDEAAEVGTINFSHLYTIDGSIVF